MRALLIRSPHIEKILGGKKTWEIRGSRTAVRGEVGFIRSGSGTVIGVCDVVDCRGPLTAEQFQKNARKAGITPGEAALGRYRETFAWILAPTNMNFWPERRADRQLRSSHWSHLVPCSALVASVETSQPAIVRD